MRKYKFLLFLLQFILASGWVQAQTIAMRVPDASAMKGDTINIPIYADSSLTGKNALAYLLQLTYNQYYIQPISVGITGTISASFGSPAVNTTVPGKITIAAAGSTPLTGSGIFIYIKFKAIQSGGSWLNFSGTANNYFNEGLPAMSFDDGYINIASPPSINIYPDNGTIAKSEHLQFNVSGGTPPFQWFVTNPSVAAIDAVGILTGIQYGFSKVVAEDNNGIRDTSGLIEIKAMRLSIPSDLSQLQGTDIDIPVNISDLNGLNILSGNFSINFYQNILSPVGIIKAGTLLESYPDPVVNLSNPGNLSFAFAGTSALTGSGTLIYIRFHVSDQYTGGSGINFTGAQFNESFVPSFTNGYFSAINLPVLSITPASGFLVAGNSQQFSALGGGIPPFTWNVSDTLAASIDQSGLMTAKRSGIVTINVVDSVGATTSSGNFQIYDTRVNMPDTATCPETPTFYYPILIESLPTGQSVFSIMATVNYDTTYLTYLDIETTGTLSEGWTFSKNPTGTKLIFAGSGSSSFNTGGTIALLKFNLKPNFIVGSYASVYLTNITLNEGVPLPLVDNSGYIIGANPGAAGTIAGPASVCQGQQGVVYTVPAIYGATGYIWTLPEGVEIVSGTNTNSITVNFSDTVVSGNITVYGTNACGNGSSSPGFYVVVNTLPGAAGTITGQTDVCEEELNVNYSIPVIANADSYIWTLPDGTIDTIASNNISVDFGIPAVSGSISVKGLNSCGVGSLSTLAINVSSLPDSALAIVGPANVCQSQDSVTYTVPVIPDATSYVWTLPDGVTGSSSTNTIDVNYGISAISGNITVKGNNTCGDGVHSTLAVIVNPLPGNAGLISGPANVTQGQSDVLYTVPVVSNATSYTWSLPSGASGTSGTNSISVSFSDTANSGILVVKGNNSCGDGLESSLAVTVNPVIPSCDAQFNYTGSGPVIFTDLSTGAPTAWTWDFGDGTFSSQQNPTHNYSVGGSYQVTLSVVNQLNNCVSVITKTVVAGSITYMADFSFVTNPSNLTVIFSDLSSASTTAWYWTMGDGKMLKTQNPTYTYSSPGVYKVCLAVFDQGSSISKTICKEVTLGEITCTLTSDFSYFINPLSLSLNVSFFSQISGEADSYFWTFGDGSSSTVKNPDHVYTLPGYYKVTLAVRNNSSKCMDVMSKIIQVGTLDCGAGFSYRVDPDIKTVYFRDDSKGIVDYYYWDFGDGSYSVLQNPDHIYDKEGLFMIGQTVIDNANGCIDNVVQPVQVGDITCAADFVTYIDSSSYTAYFTNKILGESTALLWSFGDGTFSTRQNPVKEFPGPGIYSAGLNTYNFNNGCMDYYQEMLLIGSLGNDCSADFVYRVDASGEVIFSNKSAGNIVESLWNFGDETDNSPEKDPVHSFSKGGYYYVCLNVTNSEGIRNMGCKWVLVPGSTADDCRANFLFTIDSTNLTVNFADKSFGNINKYTWDFGDSKADSVSVLQNPSHVYDEKGYYLVKLKVENTASGCTSNDYKLLNVAENQVLKAAFGYEAREPGKKVAGYPVDLVSASSGDGSTVEWDFGDKQVKKATFTVMDSTTGIVTHYYQLPGRYRVCLRISDPVSGQSDEFCNFVFTKNAVGVDKVSDAANNMNVYPNPFIDYTTINYSLPNSQFIEIAVFDQLGRRIETLIKTQKDAGNHQIVWDPGSISGVYYLKMVSSEGVFTQQLIITR